MWQLNRTRPIVMMGLLVAGIFAVNLTSAREVNEMVDAANRFLGSLSTVQGEQATFALNSEERLRFHFVPSEMFERKGLTLREMTDQQKVYARDLIRTGLSQRGYLTATQVIELEEVLGVLEAGRPVSRRLDRDPEKYYVSVFGNPSTETPWAWRFEGHHLSLHFTVGEEGIVAGSPTFVGANPAEVPDGPNRGLRVLGSEEDVARSLVLSLNESQREVAIVGNEAPDDILTVAELVIDPIEPAGIEASALTGQQRELLMDLIHLYVSLMSESIAKYRSDRLTAAGLDEITFAWAGGMESGEAHYYRVQGPTFLIEYDNTQNNANHIHSVWRDFEGDFGQDLLREHLRELAH